MNVKSQQVTKPATAKRAAPSSVALTHVRGFAGNHTLMREQRETGDKFRAQSDQLTQQPLLSKMNGQLLQRKCACGGHGGQCEACEENKVAKLQRALQKKLAVNAPGDRYEQEADRVADQVLAAPANSALSGVPAHIHSFRGQPRMPARAAPASVDRAIAGSGRALEPALRKDMEQRFGHDFSRVRIHSGPAAEQSALNVNAHAYTIGHDIVFGAGRFVTGSQSGRRLLAHELTHVVQQRIASVPQAGGAIVQRQPGARRNSDSIVVIQLKWQRHLDEADFVDRLVAAVANKRGLRGQPRDYIRAALMTPGVQFFLSHQTVFETGQQVQLRITASFDEGELDTMWVESAEPSPVATNVKPEPSSTQKPATDSPKPAPKAHETDAERVERQSGETAGVIATQLMDAYDRGSTGASFLIEFNGRELSPSAYELDTDSRERGSGEVPLVRKQVVKLARESVDRLVQSGPGKVRLYYTLEGGLNLQRWQQDKLSADIGTSAAIEEEAGECDPSDSNYGECLVLERRHAYQEGILAAGEVADAYYNPFSGGGGGGPGPMGVVKLIRRGYKVASTAKKLGGLRIRVPNVLEIRSAASTGEKLDDAIKAAAVGYRSSARGSTVEAFNRNFAAARIKFLDTGKTAIVKALNVANATHSEEEILVLISEIKKRGSNVKIEQIFTERIPCKNCMNEIITKHFGQDVDIFYFIGYSENRATELRKLFY